MVILTLISAPSGQSWHWLCPPSPSPTLTLTPALGTSACTSILEDMQPPCLDPVPFPHGLGILAPGMLGQAKSVTLGRQREAWGAEPGSGCLSCHWIYTFRSVCEVRQTSLNLLWCDQLTVTSSPISTPESWTHIIPPEQSNDSRTCVT